MRQQWQIKRGQGLELDLGLGLELELELELDLELGLDLEFLVLELDLGFESVLEQVAPGKSLRPIGGASMMGLVMSSRHSLDASMPEVSKDLCLGFFYKICVFGREYSVQPGLWPCDVVAKRCRHNQARQCECP